jgi:hypothetical protein
MTEHEIAQTAFIANRERLKAERLAREAAGRPSGRQDREDERACRNSGTHDDITNMAMTGADPKSLPRVAVADIAAPLQPPR